MNIKTEIDEILNKPMDRQGFLKHLLMGVVAVTGFSWALRMLSTQQHTSPVAGGGYGASAYGGIDDGRK